MTERPDEGRAVPDVVTKVINDLVALVRRHRPFPPALRAGTYVHVAPDRHEHQYVELARPRDDLSRQVRGDPLIEQRRTRTINDHGATLRDQRTGDAKLTLRIS
ncbi:MAG: hypothetical protein HYX56_00515 [Chloroflexi bacterium]|nr:hypothetical protein [Chloroflexota bacterium]